MNSNKTEWKYKPILVILAMHVLHVVHNQAHNYHIIILNVHSMFIRRTELVWCNLECITIYWFLLVCSVLFYTFKSYIEITDNRLWDNITYYQWKSII